jgi:eukaryotic-like serine/threonine-protein kinase
MAKAPPENQLPQFGRYLSLRILGEGATASVYLAKDPNLARKVAIKVIKPHLLNSESLLARFTTEARVVANLRHANIVQVHDYDVQDDHQYLVMEYVEGPGLQTILNNLDGQPIPPLVSIYIMYQAAQGLAAAHKQGLVHRDIKPDNMLLTTDGTVKIADFGIAHISELGMTQIGDILGTPYFMAPEQTMADPVTAQTDLWALGVVLYYCLTGHRPFEGSSFAEIKRKIREVNYLPMRTYVVSLEEPLVKIVDTLLQSAPEDRRNATWLSQQLWKYLENSGILEWEEFIKSFLGTLKSPALTHTSVEYRAPLPAAQGSKSGSKSGTKKGTRARTGIRPHGEDETDFGGDGRRRFGFLKTMVPAFAGGLIVALGAMLYFQTTRESPHPDAKVKTLAAGVVAAKTTEPSNPVPANPEPAEAPAAAIDPVSSARPVVRPAAPSVAPIAAPVVLKPIEARVESRKPATQAPSSVRKTAATETQRAQASIAARTPPSTASTVSGEVSTVRSPQTQTVPEAPKIPTPPPPSPQVKEEGFLEITSSPPWAKVFVNGKLLGATPINQKLEPGSYQLKVSHSKFPNQDKDSTVNIKAGKNVLWFQFRS